MAYEFFSHTADLGIRVQAASLNELYADAARALTAALVENPEAIHPLCEREVHLRASRLDDLLYDWLAELLYLFDAQRLVFANFVVEIDHADNYTLKAKATGEPLDRNRHILHLEVKAITYHRLRVEQRSDGLWEAEVIVDL